MPQNGRERAPGQASQGFKDANCWVAVKELEFSYTITQMPFGSLSLSLPLSLSLSLSPSLSLYIYEYTYIIYAYLSILSHAVAIWIKYDSIP